MGGVVEARGLRRLLDRHPVVAQQAGPAQEGALQTVGTRRGTGGPVEHPPELINGQVGAGGQFRDGRRNTSAIRTVARLTGVVTSW